MKLKLINKIIFIICIEILFISIGFSSYSTQPNIEDIAANVRKKENIRITDVIQKEGSPNISIGELNFNKDHLLSNATLPNEDSKITFDIEITNIGSIEMGILNIEGLPENLEYQLENYTLKDKICDENNECKLGIKKNISITIGYKKDSYNENNTTYDLDIKLLFRQFYNITYQNLDNIPNLPTTVLKDDTFILDLNGNEIKNILVEMDGKRLVDDEEYTFKNKILTIPNVEGNLHIRHLNGKKSIFPDLKFVSLKDPDTKDDNNLFAGDVYYVNPYDITKKCDASNSVDNANSNPNACMKWYEISEDDEYITLMLNSNLGNPIPQTDNITRSSNQYLKILTDSWDERLKMQKIEYDGYDYTNHKARIITMNELELMLENPNWNSENYIVNSDFIKNYYSWLYDNLDGETWYQGGYFTSTKYSDSKNYTFDVNGLDISVADEYTNGVRPVILIKKDYLKLDRNKIFTNEDVTYLMTEMLTDPAQATESNWEYHIKAIRAMGIKRAYLDLGYIRVEDTTGIWLRDTIENTLRENETKIATMIKIGLQYGVDIVPWINYRMTLDYIESPRTDGKTWGQYSIETLDKHVNDMLTNGFFDGKEKYYPREIHFDTEPMRKVFQSHYMEVVHSMSNSINDRCNYSIAAPASSVFSTEYIQEIATYVNEFTVMIYDSMGPDTWGEKGVDLSHTKQQYLQFIKYTINHYANALDGFLTDFYALGAMYQDVYFISEYEPGWPDESTDIIYTHFNFYNNEEVETMNNFLEGLKDFSSHNIQGIGIYYWDSLILHDSPFNSGSYITKDYNYKTVRANYLKKWAYKK